MYFCITLTDLLHFVHTIALTNITFLICIVIVFVSFCYLCCSVYIFCPCGEWLQTMPDRAAFLFDNSFGRVLCQLSMSHVRQTMMSKPLSSNNLLSTITDRVGQTLSRRELLIFYIYCIGNCSCSLSTRAMASLYSLFYPLFLADLSGTSKLERRENLE